MTRNLSDFTVITTSDGSPSLAIADATGYVEKMHHSAGALSESLYIYGAALRLVLENRWPLRVFSLGLGLGYNELLTAAFATRYGAAPDRSALFSFETEPLLANSFTTWLAGEPCEFSELYEDILNRCSTAVDVPPRQIRDWLRSAFLLGDWQVRGAYPDDAEGLTDITCVLYDAFSSKMNRELWDQGFLEEQMGKILAEKSVFATYAVTGNLKRALRSLNFNRLEKSGFAGKREATFAVRGMA